MGSTTVSIYREDLDWLKRKQLEMSANEGKIKHLPDVIHSLIVAVENPPEGT